MITGVELKRFFKKHFGIPVVAEGVRGGRDNGWASVRIRPRPMASYRDPLIYDQEFPAELRSRCLQLVYPNHPALAQQTSAGNIESHSLAMSGSQWVALIAHYEGQSDGTTAVATQADAAALHEDTDGPSPAIGTQELADTAVGG